MAYNDFVVKFDPDKEPEENLSKKIIHSLFINRMRYRKPAVCFIGGDSGEGKSWAVLRIQEILCELMGTDSSAFLDVMNVYIPIQYPEKLQKILYDKEYKKCHVIAIHEARDIIKAKLWHGFVSMAVADVNAQVRAIKRLAIFIVSQFIRDITNDMRYTLTYYCTVFRPLGGAAQLIIYKMWKDDRDLEHPILRKRRIAGTIIYPNGRRRYITPKCLMLSMPTKENRERFDKADREAKAGIIHNRLERMIKEMELELKVGNPKVDAMVKFYSENPDSLRLIGRAVRGTWKLNKNVIGMHDLTASEFKDFQTKLSTALKSKLWLKDTTEQQVEGFAEAADEEEIGEGETK